MKSLHDTHDISDRSDTAEPETGKSGKPDIALLIFIIILLSVLGITGLVISGIIRPSSVDQSLQYFQEHQSEFGRIAEYFGEHPELVFSVCKGEFQDLELIEAPDVQDAIRSVIDDGIIFEIRNEPGQDAENSEILFIADDLLIRNQETVAIVHAEAIPESEISYKGDSVEYSNQFASLGDHWYRKYRKS